MEINGYQLCRCGAVTMNTDDGDYCCKIKNVRRFFGNIVLKNYPQYQTTYCCDHCVNHYGLDLCGCGSGEHYGECGLELEACNEPMQVLGKRTSVLGAFAISPRRFC